MTLDEMYASIDKQEAERLLLEHNARIALNAEYDELRVVWLNKEVVEILRKELPSDNEYEFWRQTSALVEQIVLRLRLKHVSKRRLLQRFPPPWTTKIPVAVCECYAELNCIDLARILTTYVYEEVQ